MITKISIFYIQCYSDHRHLHSFPTRRSSDLSPPPIMVMAPFCVWSPRVAISALVATANAGISATPRVRSEEHTSELQSRFDLVCRLLLEKKKKKKKSIHHHPHHEQYHIEIDG